MMETRIAVLLSILVGLCLFLTSCASRQADPVAGARAQVLKLSLGSGSGSGVVIRPGLVLTAAHVAEHDGLTTHEKGAPGVRLAAGNPKLDLGLLYYPTKDASCPCVKLADHEAEVSETVYVVGYPLGVKRVVTVGHSEGVMEDVKLHSMFGDVESIGRRLVLTAGALPGNSGGGVFVYRNGEYQLVGIVVEAVAIPGGSLTFAMALVDIKKFLEEHA